MTAESKASGQITRERFLADVAGVLGVDQNELADIHDPFEAGLDSIRLMVLLEAWRDQGVSISFVELVERRDVDEWWKLIDQKLRGDGRPT
jgi:aryl carrier-like protein